MPIKLSRAAAATVAFSTPQEIVISHADDSIRIGDGSNLLSVNANGSIDINTAQFASRIDEVSSSVTYVGKAVAGTSNATAAWQIYRLTTSGSSTTIEYADGDVSFNNVWNNRASLSYS